MERTREPKEQGILIPLVLIGGFYGFLNGGPIGGFLGIAAGAAVSAIAGSMLWGVVMLTLGFGYFWLQGGAAMDIVARFDDGLAEARAEALSPDPPAPPSVPISALVPAAAPRPAGGSRPSS